MIVSGCFIKHSALYCGWHSAVNDCLQTGHPDTEAPSQQSQTCHILTAHTGINSCLTEVSLCDYVTEGLLRCSSVTM